MLFACRKVAVHRGSEAGLCLLLFLMLLIQACGQKGVEAVDSSSKKSIKPNILLILLDDLGVNDVGAYGGGAEVTPNLDRFARQGVRYSRHYTDSTCTATRVALLSGQDPASVGFRPVGAGIPAEIETLPERLRDAGYSTHHIGKWHAGFSSKEAWPNAQGFDTFFGFLNQFLLRGPHTENQLKQGRPTYHNPWLQIDAAAPRRYQGNLSQLLNDRVLSFIEDHADDPGPWFLNYWTYAPHRPLQPGREYLERHPETPEGRYLALVEQIDALIGEVLTSLEELGVADNTLVLIASDNGGTAQEYPSNAPFRGAKASFFEGGVRTPLFVRWPGRLAAGLEDRRIVSVQDYLPTLMAAATGSPTTGRNFLVPREATTVDSRTLFWEAGNSVVHSWSALDPSGRWRLIMDYDNRLHLTDLRASPGGNAVSPAEFPATVKLLADAFTNWHSNHRESNVRFLPGDRPGHGSYIGYDYMRTPGTEGWTFAVAIRTDRKSNSRAQVIAAQDLHWHMIRQSGRILVNVQGLELEAPEPAPGECTELIIGTQFSQAYSDPRFKSGLIELFYNGVRVATSATGSPGVPEPDFSAPTTVGSDADGGQRFTGQLGAARFWNERLVPDAQADSYLQNGVSTIKGELCKSLPQSMTASDLSPVVHH